MDSSVQRKSWIGRGVDNVEDVISELNWTEPTDSTEEQNVKVDAS